MPGERQSAQEKSRDTLPIFAGGTAELLKWYAIEMGGQLANRRLYAAPRGLYRWPDLSSQWAASAENESQSADLETSALATFCRSTAKRRSASFRSLVLNERLNCRPFRLIMA